MIKRDLNLFIIKNQFYTILNNGVE